MKKTGETLEGYAEDEKPFVYHYGPPGERLKNADESVKRFYADEESQSRKGFFRLLTRTRSSRLMLVTIVALVMVILATSLFSGADGGATVAGIPAQLSAFSFEDSVYVSVKLSGMGTPPVEPVLVQAELCAYSSDGQLISTEFLQDFYHGTELFLRTRFSDYGIVYIDAEVEASGKTVSLRCNVTKS